MLAPTKLLSDSIADRPTTAMPIVTVAPITPLPQSTDAVSAITSYVLSYEDFPSDQYRGMLESLIRGVISKHYQRTGNVPALCYVNWVAATLLMALGLEPYPYRQIHVTMRGEICYIAIRIDTWLRPNEVVCEGRQSC